MINELEANEIYESFKICQRGDPVDAYWAGAVSAMRAVLELDSKKTEWERKNWDSIQGRRVVYDDEPLSGRC